MQKHVLIAGLLVFLLSSGVLPGMARADVFLKQKHHTDAYQMMGQSIPAKDYTETIWITKDCMRSDSTQSSAIMRLDKGLMYHIDHTKKTYTEIPMNVGKAVNDAMTENMKGMSAEDKQAMGNMMKGMMKFSMTVTETNEKKMINKWNCRKYLQKLETAVGPTNSDVWATQDLKVDYDLVARYNALLLTSQPGLRESMNQVMQETKKVKGVNVLTNTTATIMGGSVKSSVELLEYKDGKAPATITTIPAGYKKQSFK